MDDILPVSGATLLPPTGEKGTTLDGGGGALFFVSSFKSKGTLSFFFFFTFFRFFSTLTTIQIVSVLLGLLG